MIHVYPFSISKHPAPHPPPDAIAKLSYTIERVASPRSTKATVAAYDRAMAEATERLDQVGRVLCICHMTFLSIIFIHLQVSTRGKIPSPKPHFDIVHSPPTHRQTHPSFTTIFCLNHVSSVFVIQTFAPEAKAMQEWVNRQS